MLIIPAIHIQDTHCLNDVEGEPGTEGFYGDDPVRRATVWRGENAKALHLVDLDGAREGFRKNADIIRRIVASVDIPVQIAGGIRTYDSVFELIQTLGVYRLVVSTMAVEQPDLIERIVAEFSPRKIIVGIDVLHGFVHTHGRVRKADLRPVAFAQEMKRRGIERIVYTSVDRKEQESGPPIDELKELADTTGLAITLNATVRSYADLRSVEALQSYRVDSLILSDALYRNAFPCQKIWRRAEQMLWERERPWRSPD